MSDRRQRDFERHTSPFWGAVLVFAVVMMGLIAYAYYFTHAMPGV